MAMNKAQRMTIWRNGTPTERVTHAMRGRAIIQPILFSVRFFVS